MAALATITQQPRDVRDYDIDFSEWFPQGDTITSVQLSLDVAGLTVNYAISAELSRVKVWIQDGANGTTYKVTVLAGTAGGREKEVELKVRIKDF